MDFSFNALKSSVVVKFLMELMGRNPERGRLYFRGERVKWVSVGRMEDLLELKAEYPDATMVVGNTTIGEANQSLVSSCEYHQLMKPD